MNFYSHAVVASWRSGEPAFVLGAMLPDLQQMAGERFELSGGQLAEGVRFHEQTDAVFHAHAHFRGLCARGVASLQALGVSRGGARAAAHIGVELLIDDYLFDDHGGRERYLSALAHAPGSCLERPGLSRVIASLRTRGVDRAHTSADAIARRIDYATRGRKRLALRPADLPRIRQWSAAVATEVRAIAPALLQDLATALETRPNAIETGDAAGPG